MTQSANRLKSSNCNPSLAVYQFNAFDTFPNNSTQTIFNDHNIIHSYSSSSAYAWNSTPNPNLYPNQYTIYPTLHNPNIATIHPLYNPTNDTSIYCVYDQQYVNHRHKQIKSSHFERSSVCHRQAITSGEKALPFRAVTDNQINSKHNLLSGISPPIERQAARVTSVASTTATTNHQSIYDYLLKNPRANSFTDSGVSHFVQLCILTNVQDGNCNVVLMI